MEAITKGNREEQRRRRQEAGESEIASPRMSGRLGPSVPPLVGRSICLPVEWYASVYTREHKLQTAEEESERRAKGNTNEE